ncbi:hypothetical protein ACERII_17085 [Evansella sp. AB-rgal1]|uniref:hypothetical protein n=1 Tax=Evansella sp. AB-rgal1 TaxID=3242696 RepID=UPI00359E86C6
MENYSVTFVEFLRLLDVAVKLLQNNIGLNDGEMITYRSIYNQLQETEKQFIKDKYGETLDFLENYSGLRKRK